MGPNSFKAYHEVRCINRRAALPPRGKTLPAGLLSLCIPASLCTPASPEGPAAPPLIVSAHRPAPAGTGPVRGPAPAAAAGFTIFTAAGIIPRRSHRFIITARHLPGALPMPVSGAGIPGSRGRRGRSAAAYSPAEREYVLFPGGGHRWVQNCGAGVIGSALERWAHRRLVLRRARGGAWSGPRNISASAVLRLPGRLLKGQRILRVTSGQRIHRRTGRRRLRR